MDNSGFYKVVTPNGRVMVFSTAYEAQAAIERNYSDPYISNKYAKIAEDYPEDTKECEYEDTPNKEVLCEDHYKKKTYKESIDHQYEKQVSNGWAEEESRSQPTNEAIARIQAEIDRIEAKIATTPDPENKATMTTYVAGLHKALKLIKGE